MQKEELKKRAVSLITIPTAFRPMLEEYFEGENGKGEAMFAWTSESEDEGISISLDLEGNLTRLSVERNCDGTSNLPPLSIDQQREHAEQFLLSHYPDALNKLSFYQSKKLPNKHRFYFEQLVLNMPLDHAGCFIDVTAQGEIVEFSYNGIKAIPEIPPALISKETLSNHVHNQLDFQLLITNLYQTIHDVKEDGLRLLYEPKPSFMKYQADMKEPTVTIKHDEDEPQTFIPLPLPTKDSRAKATIETIVGVTDTMEVIREVDLGNETGIVWRDRAYELENTDLSMNSFFKRRSEDTVKAMISKETGEVQSFMWFATRKGSQDLSRDACYEKALDFLQSIIPDYYHYLQLIVHEDEEEAHDATTKESFTFRIHNGHGIPLQLEMVIVAVNRNTGLIDHYSGPSFRMDQLRKLPATPSISKEEAYTIFSHRLDFELLWDKQYDWNPETYRLVYQACDRDTRTPIRYIDALTGEVITDKSC